NWIDQDAISFEEVAMIGDDINDFDIMNKIGVSACPADAVIEIKSISNIILQKKGGDGCIREFLDQYWTR
ncbi:MAG: HAD hydrolase family protein, partial [Crocinitomicaceae bacterium]|nr:HAD hydrolase family protein [Crocinitomicaceae bacterium]